MKFRDKICYQNYGMAHANSIIKRCETNQVRTPTFHLSVLPLLHESTCIGRSLLSYIVLKADGVGLRLQNVPADGGPLSTLQNNYLLKGDILSVKNYSFLDNVSLRHTPYSGKFNNFFLWTSRKSV